MYDAICTLLEENQIMSVEDISEALHSMGLEDDDFDLEGELAANFSEADGFFYITPEDVPHLEWSTIFEMASGVEVLDSYTWYSVPVNGLQYRRVTIPHGEFEFPNPDWIDDIEAVAAEHGIEKFHAYANMDKQAVMEALCQFATGMSLDDFDAANTFAGQFSEGFARAEDLGTPPFGEIEIGEDGMAYWDSHQEVLEMYDYLSIWLSRFDLEVHDVL